MNNAPSFCINIRTSYAASTRPFDKKLLLQDGKIIIDCKTDIIQKEEFDFTWYPFDAHTFKVPFVSGKRINVTVKIH